MTLHCSFTFDAKTLSFVFITVIFFLKKKFLKKKRQNKLIVISMKFEHDFSIQLYMYWSFSLCDEKLEWELLTSSVRDWCCFMILYIKTKSIHSLNDTNTFHFHFKLFAFQNSEIEVGKHLLLIKCAEKKTRAKRNWIFFIVQAAGAIHTLCYCVNMTSMAMATIKIEYRSNCVYHFGAFSEYTVLRKWLWQV